MVIEETGVNMLYLLFGFLEFFEREDSEKPLLAPLLAVPVSLERGDIDVESRSYQYSIVYSGEDIHENHTLREKLNQDFAFQLPDWEEEEYPGNYLAKIGEAIKNKNRWKVKYQLTLGFLSFGKLAIWNDLDPTKWTNLLNHPLLREVFSGRSDRDGSLFSEDYEIDKHPQSDLPLIYDADSSQHSAIIDVLSGKNLVINGPPGTGKSQTITNIIAVALRQGKKILFVSEKLAALEVVRRRLNQAHLGHFCLELHSHKTKKKKLLTDIQDRLDSKFIFPQLLQAKVDTLARYKKDLNRYAELMRSSIGNELGLSVHDILWRAEQYRQKIGDLPVLLQSLFLPDASTWSYDEIERRHAKLSALGQQFETIGSFSSSHPWWGFVPKVLTPGDDLAMGRIVSQALYFSNDLTSLVKEYQLFVEDVTTVSLPAIENLEKTVVALPDPPTNLIGFLLPKFFSQNDPYGKKSRLILEYVCQQISQVRELIQKAEKVLIPGCDLNIEQIVPAARGCAERLSPAALLMDLPVLKSKVEHASTCLLAFIDALSKVPVFHGHIHGATLDELTNRIAHLTPLEVLENTVGDLRSAAQTVSNVLAKLKHAYDKISYIADRCNLLFDGSPEAVGQLSSMNLEGVLANATLDNGVIEQVSQMAEYFLSDLPLSEINVRQTQLQIRLSGLERAINEFTSLAKRAGVAFNGSPQEVSAICALANVAEKCPTDLFVFRKSSFEMSGLHEMIERAEKAHEIEIALRTELDKLFYLDSLPDIVELKNAIRTFRRGDSFFNFLSRDWRLARKLYRGLARQKLKYSAIEYADHLNRLLTWIEHSSTFISNKEYQNHFGLLFNGVDTDFGKIRRLQTWYSESRMELIKHPGLVESTNLSDLEQVKIEQLSVQAPRFRELAIQLEQGRAAIEDILGNNEHWRNASMNAGWSAYIANTQEVIQHLNDTCQYLRKLVSTSVSPKRAAQLLNAKLELQGASAELSELMHGRELLFRAGGQAVSGLSHLKCQTWGKYLDQVGGLMVHTEQLCEYLSDYVEADTTVSCAWSFVSTKINLDKAMSAFATFPEWSSPTDWKDYVTHASSIIESANQLVCLLDPIGQVGRCGMDVLFGLESSQKAKSILSTLYVDPEINGLLADVFAGIDTHLDAIRDTYNWGNAVAGDYDLSSDSLKVKLICTEAAQNFNFVRGLLRTIVKTYRQIRNELNGLNDYGAFSWEDWHESVREGNTGDFAESIQTRLKIASEHVEAVLPWSKYHAERTDCNKKGLGDFVICLEQFKVQSNIIGSVFDFVVYRSIGRSIYRCFSELSKFSGAAHNKTREDFVTLDKEIIDLNGQSFAFDIDKAKNIPNGQTGSRASERTEMQLLLRELAKQRRHIPIRQLIKRAGRAVQALKPCFMMGPLSVAQYIEQGSVEFDLVVMDEASQLRPEEALGAIVRGKQLVVVGDPKQLPPTNFFDRLFDSGDGSDH